MEKRDGDSSGIDGRRPASRFDEDFAAAAMAEGFSPEEFAARNAHGIMCFSMDERRFADPAVDAWIQRLGDILFHRNGAPTVAELRLKFLMPEEQQAVQEYEF